MSNIVSRFIHMRNWIFFVKNSGSICIWVMDKTIKRCYHKSIKVLAIKKSRFFQNVIF